MRLLLLLLLPLLVSCASKEPRLLLDLGGFDQGADSLMVPPDTGPADAPGTDQDAGEAGVDASADHGTDATVDGAKDQALEGAG